VICVSETVALFSYGTLQDPEVQLATFGRLVEGDADSLAGYILVDLVIDDPRVVSVSGKDVHTIARHTGNPANSISGTALFLTPDELRSSDDYEVAAYARTEIVLESGRKAFVYVDAGSLGKSAR
jgi:hypothetical protein